MILLTLYRGLATVLSPAISLYLQRRQAAGKENPTRIAERYGRPGRARPLGPLIWIHAASVGEAVSSLALIDRIAAERPSFNMLITTGTVTSADILATRLPSGFAFHQFAPVDRPAYVRRFLNFWRPALALWIESELWPNSIIETHRRGIPQVLLNARLSSGSFRRWRFASGIIKPVLRCFQLCLAQDAMQADRFRKLGAPHAVTVGDLKAAAAPLPVEPATLKSLSEQIGWRPRWLAASTHEGEETIVADVHQRLKVRFPGLVTLIAPRHPNRCDAIAAFFRGRGLTVARRSLGDSITSSTELYLVDTLGELGLFYRLAGLTLICGSFYGQGGHNPLEAALLDCAILHGPDMANCASVTDALDRSGGAEMVRDAAAIATSIEHLLSNAKARRQMADAARSVADQQHRVLDAVLDRLAPWLDTIEDDSATAL